MAKPIRPSKGSVAAILSHLPRPHPTAVVLCCRSLALNPFDSPVESQSPSMEYLRTLILGVVQGITEFLPISSDGHLVLAEQVCQALGISQPADDVLLTVLLHIGTLLAILIIYWRRIVRLLTDDRRVIGLLVVGTIPAVMVGLLAELTFEKWLVDPVLTGILLPINGCMLLWGNRRPSGPLDYTELSLRQAFVIGICQATAILPGISRSGTTIVAGLVAGLRRDAAATFSFLLAIPAIGGAIAFKLAQLVTHPPEAGPEIGPLLLGIGVSLVVGLAALTLLLKWLASGRLAALGWWCIGLGLAMLAWQAASV